MANDPRISSIIDALNLTDIPDADVLTAKIVMVGTDWGDKTVGDLLNIYASKMIVSHARMPAQGDLVTGLTQIYRDRANQNLYVSVSGDAWHYQSVPGSKRNVYIGTLTKASVNSDPSLNQFQVYQNAVHIGTDATSPIYDTVSEIRAGDNIYVGAERLLVTANAFNMTDSYWRVDGNWDNSVDAGSFGASEVLKYTSFGSKAPRLIWEAPSTRISMWGDTIYNLNPGECFSKYHFITCIYDNAHLGTDSDAYLLSASHPTSEFSVSGVRWILQSLYGSGLQVRQLSPVDDTSFKIIHGFNAVSNGIGIRKLYGYGG